MFHMRRFAVLIAVAAIITPCVAQQLRPPAACTSSTSIAVGELHIQPKPADATSRDKSLIGVYERDGTVIHVLEACGDLYIFTAGAYHSLDLDSPHRVSPALMGSNTARFTTSHGGRVTSLNLGATALQHTFGEDTGKSFRIEPLRSPDELRREALAARPPLEPGKRSPDLVELTRLDPTIKLDIRYATTNNFMGVPFYTESRAFLQRPAAEAVVRANRKLKAYGYGLLIHDAYRPWYVTKMFWDATPDDKKDFVADPAKGSNHNRGGAVDISLYELSTGKPVRMPGGYDEMSDRSRADYPGGTSLERWQRDLLRAAMESQGFKVYKLEWWHFDFRDYNSYPILNVSLDRISPSSKTESNQHDLEKR